MIRRALRHEVTESNVKNVSCVCHFNPGIQVAAENGHFAIIQAAWKRLNWKRIDNPWQDVICQMVEELSRRIYFFWQSG
jgi:hypothetical protein